MSTRNKATQGSNQTREDGLIKYLKMRIKLVYSL
jgi:hypothetical protein